MSDTDTVVPLHRNQTPLQRSAPNQKQRPIQNPIIAFQKPELNTILNIYGHHVAAGDWRDYAIGYGKQKATFSIFRHTSECPIYCIIKDPKLSKKQGMYSVIDQTGRILKRGHDLAQVLKVFAKKPRLSIV